MRDCCALRLTSPRIKEKRVAAVRPSVKGRHPSYHIPVPARADPMSGEGASAAAAVYLRFAEAPSPTPPFAPSLCTARTLLRYPPPPPPAAEGPLLPPPRPIAAGSRPAADAADAGGARGGAKRGARSRRGQPAALPPVWTGVGRKARMDIHSRSGVRVSGPSRPGLGRRD